MYDFTAFPTNLLSFFNIFMTVPTYSIYGISFLESNSASQFFECIFMLLIAHYYVKKKAKLILFYTILHTFNTDTQFVWKVLLQGYFPLPCIEEQYHENSTVTV